MPRPPPLADAACVAEQYGDSRRLDARVALYRFARAGAGLMTWLFERMELLARRALEATEAER